MLSNANGCQQRAFGNLAFPLIDSAHLFIFPSMGSPVQLLCEAAVLQGLVASMFFVLNFLLLFYL